MNEKVKEALIKIRERDWIDNALDPQWASKVAQEALAALESEEPGESARSCLDEMFRQIRELGYIQSPLRLTKESRAVCEALIERYAEAYRQKKCKSCTVVHFSKPVIKEFDI